MIGCEFHTEIETCIKYRCKRKINVQICLGNCSYRKKYFHLLKVNEKLQLRIEALRRIKRKPKRKKKVIIERDIPAVEGSKIDLVWESFKAKRANKRLLTR